MALFELLTIGAIGTVAYASVKKDKKRRSQPCSFQEGITFEQFRLIAYEACEDINRIDDVIVKGSDVHVIVKSQSGISTWNFKLDFNDYGHLTGRYWMRSENSDSVMPKRVGDTIKSRISEIRRGY